MTAIRVILGACLFLAACAVSTTSPDTAPTTTADEVITTTAEGATTSVPKASSTTGSTVARPAALVFSRTAGFRHSSIEAGIEAIEEIGSERGFDVEATEDGVVLGDSLDDYDVVLFLNTTGDVLDPEQQEVMERWVAGGGGFIGIHSSADTEYGWDFYGGLQGAYFSDHPAVQEASVNVVPDHPLTAGLPSSFVLNDEWYNFQASPEEDVTVLAEVDESTYDGGSMGERHPIAWAHEFEGGRSVYLGFGHEATTFSDRYVRLLIGNALDWTANAG